MRLLVQERPVCTFRRVENLRTGRTKHALHRQCASCVQVHGHGETVGCLNPAFHVCKGRLLKNEFVAVARVVCKFVIVQGKSEYFGFSTKMLVFFVFRAPGTASDVGMWAATSEARSSERNEPRSGATS